MKTIIILSLLLLLAPLNAATLVASFSFEDNFNDTSGFGNNGTNFGATIISDGVSGKAASFDGNDFVRAADSASLDISGSYTLSAWVRTSAPGNPEFSGLVTKHFTNNNRAYGLFLNPTSGVHNQFDNTANTDFPLNDSSVLNDGLWHNVVGTYDQSSGVMKTFVNGSLTASQNVGSHTLQNAAVPLLLGAYALSDNGLTNRAFLTGDLDEIRVFDGVLNDQEVLGLFNEANVVPEPMNCLFFLIATGFVVLRRKLL